MSNSFKFLMSAGLYACLITVGVSCTDSKDFVDGNENTPTTPSKTRANSFDFSTTQEVDLIVDYSAFNANIPVFFSVYHVNPFVNENQLGEYIDESIKPVFSGYTDKNGKFDETVTLPKYAKRLHIITGNFLVGLRRTVVEVINDEARAIVDNPMAKTTRAAMYRAAGYSTNDLSTMPHLWKKNNGEQVFKPWVTPLGTWNSGSGKPDYLLEPNDPELISKGLLFTEEEMNGMFGTACDALNSGTNLKEQYRAAADLKLKSSSEVSITAMGSSTCWNSALGYYYYTGDAPKNKMDLNIIMIFPNTQDGEWPRGNYPNNQYRGNIGARRGDAVQLMYYPPKADGSLDLDNGSTVFPAGIKIGFMLKTNSWGQRGADYAVNGSSYAGKKNIWASSTDGLSFAPDGGKCPNPNGEARSAKFAYTAPNGNQYVVVSFEDACDDKDYDDLMFALNPANAFDMSDTPEIENHRAEVVGVYGFEDKWPEEGDYDMNDLMIDCKHELEFYTHPDGSKKLNKERFYLTPYHNYITLQDGLAVDIQASDIQTLYVTKIPAGQTSQKTTDKMHNKMYYYLSEFSWDKNEPRMWYLTDDIRKEEGVTYVFEVTYTKALNKGQCTIRPFLWRKLENGKQLEVHLPWVSPTSKADISLFGTGADKSDPSVTKSNGQKMYYVGSGQFPFAFYLEGVSIDAFKNTTLQRENESKRIDVFFPEFLDWSISEGKKSSDWYLKMYAE